MTWQMESKLSDKSLAALGSGSASSDLTLMFDEAKQPDTSNVKTEFPSAPLLEEALTAAKPTYLTRPIY